MKPGELERGRQRRPLPDGGVALGRPDPWLAKVSGVDPAKLERYGDEVLRTLAG